MLYITTNFIIIKHEILSRVCPIHIRFANITATKEKPVPGPRLACLKNGSFFFNMIDPIKVFVSACNILCDPSLSDDLFSEFREINEFVQMSRNSFC